MFIWRYFDVVMRKHLSNSFAFVEGCFAAYIIIDIGSLHALLVAI